MVYCSSFEVLVVRVLVDLPYSAYFKKHNLMEKKFTLNETKTTYSRHICVSNNVI